MKMHSTYKGHTIIQHGRTRLRFSSSRGPVSLTRYKGYPLYDNLDELKDDIDRYERRLQLIMDDPRL